MNKSNIRDISFVNSRNRINKRGWMRILEATVAVMIVSGVLIVVYSRQVDRGIDQSDYFYSLQKQILMEISSSSELRLNVLNANESLREGNFTAVNSYIGTKIPGAFNYTIRICVLGDLADNCKIRDVDIIREIRDKDVYVEDVVISSDLGVMVDEQVYSPRKLKLFVWEAR